MTSNDQRFNNILGEEYELLKLAYPHYDELQQAVGQAIREHFKDSQVGSIVTMEVGCGTGITTKFLLDSDSRVRVVAVDNEKKMIDQIQDNLNRWQASNRVTVIESEVGEYLKNIPDSSFDAVASGFVIHNFEQNFRRQIISEIFRVLKPGGIFVNGDKYAHDDPEKRQEIYREQIAKYDIYDTIGRSDYKKEWLAHMERDEQEDLVFFEGEAKTFMTSIGFKGVETVYRKMMEAVVVGIK